MEVGISNYQARAFWEYDISQVINNFITIESALIQINNIGDPHDTTFHISSGRYTDYC
jgi:hypothetical protein